MRPRHLLVLAVIGSLPAAVACTTHPSVGVPVAPADTGRGASQIDEYFRRASAFGFAGAVVVGRNGREVLSSAYGEADWKSGTPASSTTAFDISSLDKPLIAEAILILERDGSLSTRDSLGRFFPDAPADKRGIRLYHLLSHTGGIRDVYWDERPHLTLQEFAEYVLDSTTVEWQPGNGSGYATANYWILEAIIERVTKAPFEHFLHDRVFVPSGMTHTGTNIPQYSPGQVAHIRDWATGIWPFKGLDYGDVLARPAAFQTILSTTGDMYEWYRTLRDSTLLMPAMKNAMWHTVRANYGYGWNIRPTDRHTRLIEHGGAGAGGGMRATFRYFPDEDTFFAILSGVANPAFAADYIGRDVESLLFRGLARMPPQPRVFSDSLAAATLAGTYRLDNGGQLRLLVRPRGRLVIATDDPRVIPLLQFPELAGASEPRLRQKALVEALDSAVAGDYVLLEKWMGDPKAFRPYIRLLDNFRSQMKPLGAFRGSSVLYERPWLFDDTQEQHTFVGLRFDNGGVVLRIIATAKAPPSINVFRAPTTFSAVAAPMSDGTFGVWDFNLGRLVTLRPEIGAQSPQLWIEAGGTRIHGARQP
jgi:CubicO group peptidase (beta-lactamase class C family)